LFEDAVGFVFRTVVESMFDRCLFLRRITLRRIILRRISGLATPASRTAHAGISARSGAQHAQYLQKNEDLFTPYALDRHESPLCVPSGKMSK
jgi:hypothetical protein